MSIFETIVAAPSDEAQSPLFAAAQRRLRRLGQGPNAAGMIDVCLERLANDQDLDQEQATALFHELVTSSVDDADVGALLLMLRPERLSAATICAFARVMRDCSPRVAPRLPADAVLADTCGTGSDSFGTFNVSTTIMFILAAAGVRIAKHGNRGITSRCGSADVLAALGVHIELEPAAVARCIEDVGIGFMFAPLYHRAFKNVQRLRQRLATETPSTVRGRTVFNVLGPLANPALPARQVVGVYEEELVSKFAEILALLGLERALVAFGHCDGYAAGLDELSTSGPTTIAELKDGAISFSHLAPEDVGLARVADPALFSGGDDQANAGILRRILHGEEEGPRMDLVLMNAAAGLYLAGKAKSIAAGVARAREAIRSGAAARKLDELVIRTTALASE